MDWIIAWQSVDDVAEALGYKTRRGYIRACNIAEALVRSRLAKLRRATIKKVPT